MAHGPGKYDDEATMVRERTAAEAVVVVVVGGLRGHGFSTQSSDPQMLARLPALLRQIADQIEKDA